MPKRTVKPTGEPLDDPAKAVSKKRPGKAATGNGYQLRIRLNEVKPPIWRRVQTTDSTLLKLHKIIQISMGWEDEHLWLLSIGEQEYGDDVVDGGGEREFASARSGKLSQVIGRGVKKLAYEYDLGDGWRHTITVEKTLPVEDGVKYPRCLDGRRACPPEDCGGPCGYADFVEAVQTPKHEQHDELLDWVGGEFDPEKFDLGAVNEALRKLRGRLPNQSGGS